MFRDKRNLVQYLSDLGTVSGMRQAPRAYESREDTDISLYKASHSTTHSKQKGRGVARTERHERVKDLLLKGESQQQRNS